MASNAKHFELRYLFVKKDSTKAVLGRYWPYMQLIVSIFSFNNVPFPYFYVYCIQALGQPRI